MLVCLVPVLDVTLGGTERGTSMLTRESMCDDSNSVCGVDALGPVFSEAKRDSATKRNTAPQRIHHLLLSGSVAMGGRCVSLSKINPLKE
mmetsp:Transcript_57852/g.78854  ORF Transcript_57852/g.78854 Transcript_57852/m.78854 type:complete len:90 (-) Transcript_57852:1217-1486(-)